MLEQASWPETARVWSGSGACGWAPDGEAGLRACQHRVRHVHGTRAAYVADRCRCADCRTANRVAAQARARAIAYGRWSPFVPSGPAREHIAALRAAGVGIDQIALLAGIGSGTIRAIVYGDPRTGVLVQRVRPSTQERILAVQAPAPAGGHLVDAAATRRRVHALIAAGWSPDLLAGALGRSRRSLRRSLRRGRVTARTARAVADLYHRLEIAQPPHATDQQRRAAEAARALARRHGWHPPMAWLDVDQGLLAACDVSDDLLDVIAIERAMAGDPVALTPAEQTEAVRRLTDHGWSVRQIADLLHTSPRTVSRRRAGNPTDGPAAR